MKEGEANFAMAIDRAGERVLAVFRKPARIVAFSMRDGSVSAKADTCGDADDIFVDPKRDRIYVSCGEGSIDVFQSGSGEYKRLGPNKDRTGRTNFAFCPGAGQLFPRCAGDAEPRSSGLGISSCPVRKGTA
jgi:hypothetical protein